MKKLNKLQIKINSERIIKDEELFVLSGGDEWYCFCYGGNMNMTCYGRMAAEDWMQCQDACYLAGFPDWSWSNIFFP
ncbi:MAG: hypothetical protein RBT35_08495 [Bacteroidales bacterium]|jgi:natural product precursor|nr:hypothetical protein [Bacteroidales bacterium]